MQRMTLYVILYINLFECIFQFVFSFENIIKSEFNCYKKKNIVVITYRIM